MAGALLVRSFEGVQLISLHPMTFDVMVCMPLWTFKQPYQSLLIRLKLKKNNLLCWQDKSRFSGNGVMVQKVCDGERVCEHVIGAGHI